MTFTLKRIASIFIGVPTLIIIVFFYGGFTSSGGFDGAGAVSGFLFFAAISIICTAGISLVIWLPLLWLLGETVLKIIGLFFRKKPKQLSESITGQSVGKSLSTPSSNNELAIIGYIVSSRNTGTMTDVAIKLNLKSGGWNDKDIEEAFKKSAPRT